MLRTGLEAYIDSRSNPAIQVQKQVLKPISILPTFDTVRTDVEFHLPILKTGLEA